MTDIVKNIGPYSIKLPVIALLALLPYLANAGFFSFLNENSNVGTTTPRELNSQTVPVLYAAINTDPNPAKGGGDITVVDKVALLAETGLTGSIVQVNERRGSGQISIYEVREGDTLSQIAEMFGVSTNTIRWANDFEGAISPGQTLVILPVTGIKHIVKTGGTISDIAKIYDGDSREIALFNGISVDTELNPGDEILVPNGEMAEKESPKKAKSTSGSGSKLAVSGSGGSYSGYYIRPINGGRRTTGIHGYNAVDLAASAGSPIYAAASGTVILSRAGGWNGGYGNYVVIKHDNGTQTLYAHNTSNSVASGQRVKQGEVIGYVGSTGKSTGPHVHFEVRGAKNPF